LGLFFLWLTTFCYSQNKYYVAPWAQKLFLGVNIFYDYEKLTTEDEFIIESDNMLFEIAFGYDFGRIVVSVKITASGDEHSKFGWNIHHKKPKSKGGSDIKENLEIVHILTHKEINGSPG
jgi:hypothetical protein